MGSHVELRCNYHGTVGPRRCFVFKTPILGPRQTVTRPDRCVKATGRNNKGSSDESMGNDSTQDLPESDQAVLGWVKAKIERKILESTWPNSMAELLSFCMMLSLEELADDPSSMMKGLRTENVQLFKSTWSADIVKSMALDVRETFMRLVNDGERPSADYNELVRVYPTTLVTAINHVLFEQQGYQRMSEFGNTDCFQMSRVLDQGVGSPILLSILYMAIAEESGLLLSCLILEEGAYCMLWAEGQPLSVGGETFLIDAYARGSLMAAMEISELFDVKMPFKPSSYRHLAVAALLQLLQTHWCLALECPPEPAFALPLNLELALGEYSDVDFTIEFEDGDELPYSRGQFWSIDSEKPKAHIQRCISAAEKLCMLQGNSNESKLRLSLVLFFAKEYDRADSLLEDLLSTNSLEYTFDPSEVDRMRTLSGKCKLLQLV